VWEENELDSVLGSDAAFAKSYFSIGPSSLWEGKHILLRTQTDEAYAQSENQSLEEVKKQASTVREKLLAARSNRIPPGIDDKSLTSWNALMQIGLLDAYEAFGDERFLQGAQMNAQWILQHQLREDGQLYHSFKNGTASIDGFLEDYAFTIAAFIKMYENTFDETYLDHANELTQYTLAHFYDEKSGMFFFSSDTEGGLIARKMEITDNVIPSSNSIMANVLLDLGILLDQKEYKEKSRQMLANIFADMPAFGSNYSNWGQLALKNIETYYEVAITGENCMEYCKALQKEYRPNCLFMGAKESSDLAMLEGKFLGETTVFVCIEGACKMPTTTVEDALSQME
jgi:hypothetical protein